MPLTPPSPSPPPPLDAPPLSQHLIPVSLHLLPETLSLYRLHHRSTASLPLLPIDDLRSEIFSIINASAKDIKACAGNIEVTSANALCIHGQAPPSSTLTSRGASPNLTYRTRRPLSLHRPMLPAYDDVGLPAPPPMRFLLCLLFLCIASTHRAYDVVGSGLVTLRVNLEKEGIQQSLLLQGKYRDDCSQVHNLFVRYCCAASGSRNTTLATHCGRYQHPFDMKEMLMVEAGSGTCEELESRCGESYKAYVAVEVLTEGIRSVRGACNYEWRGCVAGGCCTRREQALHEARAGAVRSAGNNRGKCRLRIDGGTYRNERTTGFIEWQRW